MTDIFDPQALLGLGLPNQVISIWLVFVYVALMTLFLLFRRVKLCLIVTFLFTYYWAFSFYWGQYIADTGSFGAFLLYLGWGVAIVVLYIAASFYERAAERKMERALESEP